MKRKLHPRQLEPPIVDIEVALGWLIARPVAAIEYRATRKCVSPFGYVVHEDFVRRGLEAVGDPLPYAIHLSQECKMNPGDTLTIRELNPPEQLAVEEL